jgi:hypothetical protein
MNRKKEGKERERKKWTWKGAEQGARRRRWKRWIASTFFAFALPGRDQQHATWEDSSVFMWTSLASG